MLKGAIVSLFLAVSLLILGVFGAANLSIVVVNPLFSVFVLIFGVFLAGYATRNAPPSF
jgi:hypothetical protein